MRPSTNGPRSVMRTMAELPVLILVTRTTEPNGNVRCAAVMALHVVDFAVRAATVVIRGSIPTGEPGFYSQRLTVERDFQGFVFIVAFTAFWLRLRLRGRRQIS